MNVQAKPTKNYQDEHYTTYNPFEIQRRQSSCKTQVNFEAATLRASIQLFSGWIQNVSRGWPMPLVDRLEVCTMQINILL